jgi:heterodisulfide reductase subunit B
VATALDVELVELSRWNCCGGVSVASLKADALAALGRRNLAQVPAETPELLCPCPHCYTNLARALLSAGTQPARPGTRAADPASPGEGPTVELRHILDVFAREEVLARLVERRKEPLTDLRMVAYYGCKLLRPDPEVRSLRRAEAEAAVSAEAGLSPQPGAGIGPRPGETGRSTSELSAEPGTPLSGGGLSAAAGRPLERVIEACGATVAEWPAGGDCCGSALGVAEPEVADELLGCIFQAALAAGAEAIVVACPLCHLNLDLRQYQVSQRLGRGVDIPVFFLTELMAVALGMEESEDWLERHVTSHLPMSLRWIEAQEEREYWGEEGPPDKEGRPPGGEGGQPASGASPGGEADVATVASGTAAAEEKGSTKPL